MPAAMKQSILPSAPPMRSSHGNLVLDAEQNAALESALCKVQQLSTRMIQLLDAGKLMEAIQCCSSLLGELCTGHLSPKMYYTLYIAVSDSLGYLSLYLSDNFLKDETARLNAVQLVDLYELVQYAGSIIPRLYLLLTVGTVWIQMRSVPWTSCEHDRGYSAEDYTTCRSALLKDMLEMARGVQHPVRGLFLRHYLSSVVKDQLPDVHLNASSAHAAAFQDSVDFILTNFAEMNKLWVRLSFLGPSKERGRREAERMELRILIGTNLVRLSQLEGVDLVFYKNVALPAILREVVGCGDKLAQEYLMEVLIQVFSIEYHLHTLPMLLEAAAQLRVMVNISTIYEDLMDRLCEFARSQPLRELSACEMEAVSEKEREEAQGEHVVPGNIDLFKVFFSELGLLVQDRADFSLEETLRLACSLQKLSLAISPNRLGNVEALLSFIYERLHFLSVECVDELHASAGAYLVSMISLAIELSGRLLDLLCLDVAPALVARFLSFEARKSIALRIIDFFFEKHARQLWTRMHVEKLLLWMSPLIHPEEAMPQPGGARSPLPSSRESSLAASPADFAKSPALATPRDAELWSLGRLEELAHEQGRLCRLLNLCQPYALLRAVDPAAALAEAESYLCLLDLLANKLERGGSLRFRFTGPTLFHLAKAAFCFLCACRLLDAPTLHSVLQKYFYWLSRLLASLAYGDDGDEEAAAMFEQLGHAVPTFTFSCSFGQQEQRGSQGPRPCKHADGWSLYASFASKEHRGLSDLNGLSATIAASRAGSFACFSRSYVFELSFRLALDLGLFADLPTLGDLLHEALAASLVWYEEGIVDSRAQVAALGEFIGTLARMQHLPDEAMHIFAIKALAYSGQLLRRQEAAHLVGLCAYLYYAPQPGGRVREDERACHCLVKASQIARSISDRAAKAIVLLDLMDVARALDEDGCDGIESVMQGLSGLVSSIAEQLSGSCAPENLVWIMERLRGQRFKMRRAELSILERLEPRTSLLPQAEAGELSRSAPEHPAAGELEVEPEPESKAKLESQHKALAIELPLEFRDTHSQWLSDDKSPSSSERP